MFEAIKDEKEMLESHMDARGMTAMERLGFAAPDKLMQMLADIAARAGAEGAATPVIPESFFGAVNEVCHFSLTLVWRIQRGLERQS